MNRLFLAAWITIVGLGFALTPNGLIAGPVVQDNVEAEPAAAQQGMLKFSFSEAPWKAVIGWFAEQTGYSLESISDYPSIPFSLKEEREFTPMDALDELNKSLRSQSPPKTLLLSDNKLYLFNADDPLPDHLVQTVTPAELDQRGRYETLQVKFDLEGLSIDELRDQLDQNISNVNRSSIKSYPSTNEILIREIGSNLRVMRDLIERAQQKKEYASYTLKHYQPELFLETIRPLIGLDEGQNRNEDLVIVIDPSGLGLKLRGTEKARARFFEAAEYVDVPPSGPEMGVEAMSYRKYVVLADFQGTYDIVDRFLFGRGDHIRLHGSEETGTISVYGRESDHKVVQEVLDKEAGAGSGLFIARLENGKASDIVLKLKDLWQQNAGEAGTVKGPVMLADSAQNTITVSGKPQDVERTRLMIQELDLNAKPVLSGPRTTTRVISMTPREQDKLMDAIPDLWPTTGRLNPVRIKMPQDRSGDYRDSSLMRARETESVDPTSNDDSGNTGGADRMPDQSNRFRKRNYPNLRLGLRGALAGMLTYTPVQTVDEPSPGETLPDNNFDDEYIPPPQAKNVPGDEIRVRATNFGMVIESNDLDALDDLEYLIRDMLDEESEEDIPAMYLLKYRKVASLKASIEEFFGVESAGGGGAGGAGGLLGGMMGNMLGETAGEAAGGLLGLGGGGGGGGEGLLEGDVRFGMDVKLNMLYAVNATVNDIEFIDYIVDILDRPTPPHDPELQGQFRTIDVIYRDAETLKDVIEAQLSDYFQSGNQGGAENQEAAMAAEMLKRVAGGGGGGNKVDPEKEKPTATLGVDVDTNQILVTGPLFIYNEVAAMVVELDQQSLNARKRVLRIKNLNGNDPEKTIMMLQQVLGDKKLKMGGDGSGATAGSTTSSGNSNANSQTESMQKQAEAQRNNALRALQMQGLQQIQRAQRANQRGGGQRGGGQRGGGQGGGQRGGRGGR